MVTQPAPPPEQGAEPDSAAPVAQPDAEPEKGKPIVLATGLLEEFVVPAELNDKGEPKGDPITVTSAGVALSKTDAKRVTEAAANSGVTLIEKDGH